MGDDPVIINMRRAGAPSPVDSAEGVEKGKEPSGGTGDGDWSHPVGFNGG